jgi:YfiH family protein
VGESFEVISQIRHIFTSRSGGISSGSFHWNNLAVHVGDQVDAVTENRRALARSLGLDPSQLFFMNQVHGTTILEIDSALDANLMSQVRECDGMITSAREIGLAVLVADCAPVLMSNSRKIAAIHVGWRGLFGGIVEKALDLMSADLLEDGDDELTLRIGPTICGKCYQVGADLATEAERRGFTLGKVSGKPTLDIPQSIINIARARELSQKISAEWNGCCTYESSEHFSYRREKVTGRQAGVIIRGSQR